MVLPPTLQRHELAKGIHATFLYSTARLPPLFDAVASGASRTSKARSCSQTTWILGAYPFSIRCTTKSIAKKSPTGSLPPAVPLAITPTFRPWTHTSDDSYIYQLSLVVATATASYRSIRILVCTRCSLYLYIFHTYIYNIYFIPNTLFMGRGGRINITYVRYLIPGIYYLVCM